MHSPRFLAALGLACCLVPAALAQVPTPTLHDIERTPRIALAPPALLARYSVTAGTLQELDLELSVPGRVRTAVLLGDRTETFDLRPRDLRTPSYQLHVETSSGWQLPPRDACVTYRGSVDSSGAPVAATWDPRAGAEGRFEALALDGAETWIVQPLDEAERVATGCGWLVHRGTDRIATGETCGAGIFAPRPVAGAPESTTVLREAEIALDADREFWVRNGSDAVRTQNTMLGILNAVDLIYRRDTCLQYFVSALYVRTTPIYASIDMNALLGEFQSYWSAQHTGVQRDIAHLFTGKGTFSGTVGIAYLGAMCDLGMGYGVSRAYSSSFSTNVELVAHELGHNWNAPHCSGSGCRIMCASLGACSGITNQFDAPSINSITSYARTLLCLRYANGTPVLQSLQPSSAEAYGGAVINAVGTGFLGTQSVTIGGVSVPLASIYVQDDSHLDITVPQMAQLGPLPVVVTNSNASSNALPLQIVSTSPPRLEVTPLVALSGQTVTWRFGGDGDDLWTLAITANDPTTIPLFGSNLLAAGYPILSGVASPAGLGSLALPNVPRLPGLIVYSQIWFLSNTSGGFGGASNVDSTVFF